MRVARAFADSLGALLPLPPHRPSTLWQVVAAVVCLTGIAVGYAADNQLRAYMTNPNKPMLLETGLWKFSRHPNHFGEQTWWYVNCNP